MNKALNMADAWNREAALMAHSFREKTRLEGRALQRCADRVREEHGLLHLTGELSAWRQEQKNK